MKGIEADREAIVIVRRCKIPRSNYLAARECEGRRFPDKKDGQ